MRFRKDEHIHKSFHFNVNKNAKRTRICDYAEDILGHIGFNFKVRPLDNFVCGLKSKEFETVYNFLEQRNEVTRDPEFVKFGDITFKRAYYSSQGILFDTNGEEFMIVNLKHITLSNSSLDNLSVFKSK